MQKEVIYYSSFDEDFAGNDIAPKPVNADFPYEHNNIFWRIAAKLFLSVIAYPAVFLVCKMGYGLKFENRRAVKKVNGACCFYMNHTHNLDCFVPYLAVWPKRNSIITGPEAVSIRGVRNLVLMLGAIPIPSELAAYKGFYGALDKRIKKGHCVSIFPEAHIWRGCTFIRRFSSVSFRYPVSNGIPAMAAVLTRRKRKGLFSFIKSPAWTVTVSEPFYPDKELPRKAAEQDLCDRVYQWMKATAESHENVETVKYIRVEKSEETAHK